MQSAPPMPCRIAGHSGSCTALRSLANPLLGLSGRRRREGGEQDYYCSQNKPASDYEPKSSGKMSATRPRCGPSVQETEGAEAGDGGLGRFPLAGCIGSGFSRSLSLSLSLLFRSANVRSRSLVSGNDLTQQTESSGRAEQSRGERRAEERRGGATSPPPGSTHA